MTPGAKPPRLKFDAPQQSHLEAGDSNLRGYQELHVPDDTKTLRDRLQNRNYGRKKQEHTTSGTAPAKKPRLDSVAAQRSHCDSGHSALRASQELPDLDRGYLKAAGRYKPLLMSQQIQEQRQQMQHELNRLVADYLADDCAEVYGNPLTPREYHPPTSTVAASLYGASSRSIRLSEERPLLAAADPLSVSKERFLRAPSRSEHNRTLLSLNHRSQPNSVKPFSTGIYDPFASSAAQSLHGASTRSVPYSLFADEDSRSIAKERLLRLREKLLREKLLRERFLRTPSSGLNHPPRRNTDNTFSARANDSSASSAAASVSGASSSSVPLFAATDPFAISEQRLLEAHSRCELTRALLSRNLHPLSNEIGRGRVSRSSKPARTHGKPVSSSIPPSLAHLYVAVPTTVAGPRLVTKQNRSANGGYSSTSSSLQEHDPKSFESRPV